MLWLTFAVEPDGMKGYSIAPHPAPCTPTRLLHLRVRFAGLLSLLQVWTAIHTDEHRPNKRVNRAWLIGLPATALIVLVGVVVGYLLWVNRPPQEAPPQDELSALGFHAPSGQPVVIVPFPEPVQAPASSPAVSTPTPLSGVAAAIKIGLMLGSPVLLLFGAFIAGRLRPALIDIYVVPLRPHEPFPAVEHFLARERDKQVFVIRFLSESTYERFFGRVFARCAERPIALNSVGVTHAGIPSFASSGVARAMMGYWSIVRLSIGLLVEEHAESKARAIGFSYKQHEWLFMGYFALLSLAVLIPAWGLTPADAQSQFTVLMSGLGFFWTGIFLLFNRGMSAHLGEWERRTASAPFMGCPVFRYSERDIATGRWEAIDLKAMEAPIRQMGLPGDKMLELALSVMLILYLTVLQLIK
ncbi:MAG: hypothetical protein J7598_05355 [Mitsuaria chitosanitabida]|jgi:hypothetical protein|uniref:hypothetical protein n=1 Tax=Roseateles chitosanitabidus TaxID=65048 RepID=UPI001B15A83D|nr:hypothetical protein [Roseateles chitosanitabidus]MBO9686020.1 hypothetical protein [Roseateles chitosanitabidus]